MGFRARLALFFVLSVVIPMLAMALVLFGLIGQSEHGKYSAAMAARHDVARQLFREQRDLARIAIAEQIASDRVFSSSLVDGDRRRAAKRARQLVTFRGLERVAVVRDRRTVVQAGDKTAIAPAIGLVASSTRRSVGRLEVSVIDARSYARRVRHLTGLHTVVRDGRTLMASTLSLRRKLRFDGDRITVGGREYRIVSFGDPKPFTGQRLRISTLAVIDGTGDRVRDARITVGLILLGFFVIAIVCAVLVSRETVHLHEAVVLASLTDELTGLPNRRAFRTALTRQLQRSKRDGTNVGLVILDVDNFKLVNDTYGHEQGDAVLRDVARVLRETCRDVDLPARSGIGDELATIVPETDLEGTFMFAERVRRRIGELRIPRQDGEGEIAVTTSCGVAAVPPVAANDRALKKAADDALYEAKRTGRNKTVRTR